MNPHVSGKTSRTKISHRNTPEKRKKNNKETKRVSYSWRGKLGEKRKREEINRVRSLGEREREKKKMQRYLRQKLKRERKKNWRASFNVIMKGYTVGADKGRVGRCQ